jgi:hypothetical protein
VLFNAAAVLFSAAAAGGDFEVEFEGIVVFEIITAVPFATLGSEVVEAPAVSVTVLVIVFGGSETVDVTLWPDTNWVIVDIVPGWVRTMIITWTEELDDEELDDDEEESAPLEFPAELEVDPDEDEPEPLPLDELDDELEELELLDPEPAAMLATGGGGAAWLAVGGLGGFAGGGGGECAELAGGGGSETVLDGGGGFAGGLALGGGFEAAL